MYNELRIWEKQNENTPSISAPIPEFPHRIWISPDDGNGNILVWKIDASNRNIDLNVYILSDVWLINSLISAHRRNISIRVILERSTYENPKGNAAVFSQLQNEGISVVWADEVRQNFNHAKYILIDDTLYLATSNFTTTSFTKNREFLIETADVSTVEFIKRLFVADYYKFPFHGSMATAYVSPIDSREKIEMQLKRTQKEVYFFAASLSDLSLLAILAELRAKGVVVNVCLAYESSPERMELKWWMEKNNVTFRQAKSPYVHAKSFLIDNELLFIGSENFTRNSLDQNRETGLILRNSYFIKKYKETIMNDCRDI